MSTFPGCLHTRPWPSLQQGELLRAQSGTDHSLPTLGLVGLSLNRKLKITTGYGKAHRKNSVQKAETGLKQS